METAQIDSQLNKAEAKRMPSTSMGCTGGGDIWGLQISRHPTADEDDEFTMCHGGFQKPLHVSKSHSTLSHYDVWVPSIIIGWFSYIKRDQSTIL